MPTPRLRPDERRTAPIPPGPVLLETKLHIPAPDERLVARPKLLHLLDAAAYRRLTLVAAPTGFGKTTLVAAWCATQGDRRAVAWVSLDSGDNDPSRLWTYVAEALSRIHAMVGQQSLAALRAPGVDLAEVALPLLLNELAAHPHPVILVLDDYQTVTNPVCHELLALFTERLPATLHLVVATRVHPPIPLARLRARGQLAELDATDLRFTAHEATELLNERLGLGLDPSDVAILHERTEGWPAGLYLAAVALGGHGDLHARVASFSGSDRHVLDYLGEELLRAQPAELQRFLTHTSILERLSAPLCEAVTGTSGAAATLERLERENLLVVALDRERSWYRYHHLFTDMLRHELTATEPELVPELHRRASGWFEGAGFPADAIRHATAAGDLAQVRQLVARHWIGYLDRWRVATVRGWLDALPPTAVMEDPVLVLVSAWIALASEEPAELGRWLDVAERIRWNGPLADGTPSLDVGIASLRAVSGFHGVGSRLAAARRVLDLEADRASPWRQTASWALAYALYLSGRVSEAQGAAEEALAMAAAVPLRTTLIRSLALVGLIAHDRGDEETAERLGRSAQELVEESGLTDSPVVANAHTLVGRIRMDRGDLDGALAAHQRAFSGQRYPIERFHALVELLPALHAFGDRQGLATLLAKAARLEASGIDLGVLPAWLRARVPDAPAMELLSPREVDVLRLLAAPLTQRDISQALYISKDTVKSHTRAIYRKLGVDSRKDAVAAGRRLGLIR
jgi:LuxR family transcriptional regulator, maltose regulon positive regulatory protein